MVDTTLSLLPYLGITVSINIILGLFHSTRTLHERFSIKKFLISLLKSIIIGTSFISLAFVFDKMDLAVALRDYLIEPDLLLYSAIIVYLSKALVNLQNILGVNKLTEKQTKILNFTK